MLEVRRLRLLRELAARGTVTAVADALSYTPSAVSQQLAQLERDAGVQLLERVGRGVRLTDSGRLLVSHADAVLARLEAAEADLAGVAGRVAGRLRVAAFQTGAHALGAPALAGLARRHPELRGQLVQADAEVSLPALRLGDVDVVLAEEYDHAPRPRDPALERIEICRDPLVFAVPTSHPLASRDTIAFADLAGEQWVGGESGTNYAVMLERACRSLGGFEPDVVHEIDDVRLMLRLVADNGAVALVPELGQPALVPEVVVRPPATGPIDRSIFVAFRRGTGDRPSVRAFAAALVARAEELGLDTNGKLA
jgi:DNA-binding transcriptional LysR family regulator